MNLITRLTDNYNKSMTGNIGKLFTVIDLEFEKIKNTLETIELYRKIDNAVGVTLDNIGKNVGQQRGALDDIVYKIILKTKIKSNISGGQIETLNEILNVILGDKFLGAHEVWNDIIYSKEPAAIEMQYINYFNDIRSQYINNVNTMTYLDGTYSLDGTIPLDGGLTFVYSDYEYKINDAMIQNRQIINFIKAGGVKAYWCEPKLITTGIITTVGNTRITALGTFPTINYIGFGTKGHDPYTGDTLILSVSETVVPGEILKKSITSFNLIAAKTAETSAELDFSDGNGNSISSFGLYENTNLIALYYASPSPKTINDKISIVWDQNF